MGDTINLLIAQPIAYCKLPTERGTSELTDRGEIIACDLLPPSPLPFALNFYQEYDGDFRIVYL